MKSYVAVTAFALFVSTQSALAGIDSIPIAATSVPVDSPWVISGLVMMIAVVGARLLSSRRK